MTHPLSGAPSLGALFAGVAALALALPGCGGGSDSSANPPSGGALPPPPPASVAISGVVADGPLQGATACYDLNDNGACDSGEPTSAATPADGSFTINVLTRERGGTVYFGYRNASNITHSTLRLNLPAANAVLGTLGIAAITP